MPAIREILSEGWRVRLDTSRQVLDVEVPEVQYGYSERDDDALQPTLPVNSREPVSAATMFVKAKQFDDGLYAAVELAAQGGRGRFRGKAGLLRDLAAAVTDPGPAGFVAAACRLGGVSVPLPAELNASVEDTVARFLADERHSKPLGFYSWSAELAAVFRQDRFLQQLLDPRDADALAASIAADPRRQAAHAEVCRLACRMTNPPAGPGLFDRGPDRSFLPASRSHEGRLIERLFGDRPIPDGFDLMTEVIGRVRSGELDLTPTDESGWYDRQAWSLEPLAAPDRSSEAARLLFGPRYRRHLEEVFRGALALARETHVKQLAVVMAGCIGPRGRPIYVRPALSAEPVPECYAHRAAGYRFVRDVLDESFGADWRSLRRLTAEGVVETPLGDELDFMERLFDGAAASSLADLGVAASSAGGSTSAFAEWRSGLSADPDVARDARMMVPVFHDLGRRKTKVWAFLGWRTVPVDVRYEVPPAVVAVESERPADPEPEPTDRLSVLRQKFRKPAAAPSPEVPAVEFAADRYQFAVPVVAEVYVTKLLDRDEFRRHCDRHRTRGAILAGLG